MPLKITFFLLTFALFVSCSGGNLSPNVSSTGYYNDQELKSLGFKLSKVNEDQSLLCHKNNPSKCVCYEAKPLTCEADNSCVSLDENVRVFQQALDASGDGVLVSCNGAVVGRCDDFSYFDFDGDIDRREVRWFDREGSLVGMRNATDHFAYCKGKALIKYSGKIPKCAKSIPEKTLCGDPYNHGLSPVQSLGAQR